MRYEFTNAEGRTCCASDNIEYLCVHCRAAAEEMAAAVEIPNPYAKGLAAMRAAEAKATPESAFAERWAEERRKELGL